MYTGNQILYMSYCCLVLHCPVQIRDIKLNFKEEILVACVHIMNLYDAVGNVLLKSWTAVH